MVDSEAAARPPCGHGTAAPVKRCQSAVGRRSGGVMLVLYQAVPLHSPQHASHLTYYTALIWARVTYLLVEAGAGRAAAWLWAATALGLPRPPLLLRGGVYCCGGRVARGLGRGRGRGRVLASHRLALARP